MLSKGITSLSNTVPAQKHAPPLDSLRYAAVAVYKCVKFLGDFSDCQENG